MKTISDLMHPGVISCTEETPIPEVARKMVEHDISAVVVVDEEGCLAGIISRTDLVVLYGHEEMWPHLKASQVMLRQGITIAPDAPAPRAAQMLTRHRIHRLVVTDDQADGRKKPVGVISMTDIVRDMALG